MLAILDSIEQRQRRITSALKSANGFSTPSLARNHAYILGKEGGGTLGYNDASAGLVGQPDGKLMRAKFVISSEEPDREGDIVMANSPIPYLDNYKRARGPVFWGHQQFPMPIGNCVAPDGTFEFWCKESTIEAAVWFAQTGIDPRLQPTGAQMFGMVEAGLLCSTSIGFHPIKGERRKKDAGKREAHDPLGFLFWVIDVLEWSLVGTAMNSKTELISVGLSKGVLFGDPISPVLRKALVPMAVPMTGAVRGGYDKHGPLLIQKGSGMGKSETAFVPGVLASLAVQKGTAYGSQATAMRWNKQLDDAFDVAEQEVEPYSMLIDWASRYLKVPVKKIYQTSETIPGVRMGDYLTGLRNLLAETFSVDDTRNLRGSSEVPPFYDTIKLNSKKSDTFLLEGTVFYKGQQHGLVVDVAPSWGGIELTYYVPFEHQAMLKSVIAKAHEWAKANNSLRGEKFSLSGEFLETTAEDWGDLFLEEINFTPLKRVIDRVNTKGKDCPNHGMILSGPPGTGKTLASRIAMNKADATFIWVSARDFHYAGSFGGMTMAFDLAKELAPSIIVFEDVDNWMGENSVDFMKTEMDGMARYKGVVTLLTTNFPERIPEALIDRPGRFHDVLQFAVPTADARKQMLTKWVPGITDAKLISAVASTEEYSGAHIYHLAAFAKSLQESEALGVDEAVELAIAKVREQRELINGIQLEGSRYRPRKEIAAMVRKGEKGATLNYRAHSFVVKGIVPKGTTPGYDPYEDGWNARGENRPLTDNRCSLRDERKQWNEGWHAKDLSLKRQELDKETDDLDPDLVDAVSKGIEGLAAVLGAR